MGSHQAGTQVKHPSPATAHSGTGEHSLSGLDALPGGRQLDEYPLLAHAGLLVQLDEALCAGHHGILVE